MPLVSAACNVLHVSSLVLLVLLLSATGTTPVSADSTSSNEAVTMAAAGGIGNSSAPAPPPPTAAGNIKETYLCHLCLGRHMLSRRVCPAYWPDCHAICDEQTPHVHAARGVSTGLSAVPNDDFPCYVVKIYDNGTHAIVQYLECMQTRWCYLTCGGDDVAAVDGGRVTGGVAAASSLPPASTSLHGMLPPHVAEMQVCNSQVTARGRAVPPRGA